MSININNKFLYLGLVLFSLALVFMLATPTDSLAQCEYCVDAQDPGACYRDCVQSGNTTPPPSTDPLPGGTETGGDGTGSSDGSGAGSSGGSAPKNPEGVINKLCGILRPAFWVLMFLSLAFLLYASFLYVTSSGDPEKIKTANKTILFAAIAIAVALLAKELPWIVSSLVNINLPSDAGVSAVDSSC